MLLATGTAAYRSQFRVLMETPTEDKFVPDESLVGLEPGLLDVARNREPYEGMLFESDEAAKTFYDAYARRIGFFTRIVSSRKSEHDGSVISRRLACNKEGYNLSSQKTGRDRIRKRESKREGCMAMILVKREKPGKWVVTKFVKEHNHPLVISSGKDRPIPHVDIPLSCNRRIKDVTSFFCLETIKKSMQDPSVIMASEELEETFNLGLGVNPYISAIINTQDDKDRRIRELSSKLYQTNQRLAACREQLQTIMEHVEEHTQYLSRTVEGTVSNVKEVESKDRELSHPS